MQHSTSPDVDGPTVTTVLRRGYRFGERVLREALVGVTDHEPAAASDENAESAESGAATSDTASEEGDTGAARESAASSENASVDTDENKH